MDSSASEALFASTRPATPSTAASAAAASSPTASTSTSQPPETNPTPPASTSSDQLEVEKEDSFVKGLEAEVGQVMGSWKSFWGGVSKQVAPTLAAVQKDLTSAASQAKAELNRLQAQAAEARAAAAANEASSPSVSSGDNFAGLAMMGDMGIGGMPAGLAVDGGKGKEKETQLEEEVRKGVEQAGEAITSLFTRLQSSLPKGQSADGEGGIGRSLPSLASFQQSLSSTLASHPNLDPKNLNITDLRSSLTSTFQKLQTDLHLADAEKMAEEYLKKSEGILLNAGQFFQDAIKIVPPTSDESDLAGVAWDGSDAWTIPTDTSNLNSSGGRLSYKQTDAQVSKLTGQSITSVRQTRHAASLHALRSNRDLLLVDLDSAEGGKVDEDVRASWSKWVGQLETDGGLEGEKWTEKMWAELGPTKGDGVEELKAMRDELVPSKMDKDTFWKRYFFRVHQIELDAERRAALLDTSNDAEEELFSWDDEDDSKQPSPPSSVSVEPSSTSTTTPQQTSPQPPQGGQTTPKSSVPTSPSKEADGKAPSTAHTSPRESSEGSYDIVSNTSGQTKVSTTSSPTPTVQPPSTTAAAEKTTPAAADDEDEDSDWE